MCFRRVLLTSAVSAASALSAVCAIVTTRSPGWTFVENEAPVFSVKSVASPIYWTIEAWQGNPIKTGTWPEHGKLELSPLPPGYYRVTCSNATGDAPEPFDFCVTAANRCRNDESCFAADAAISGCSRRGSYDCPWYEGDCARVTAELLGKCGIVHTRERLEWGPFISPKKGVRDFSRYLHTAEWMKTNGVVSTGIFHDTPHWLRGSGSPYPSDLMELYRFMEDAARTFEPYYDSWEYWNEQELGAAPVWEYVAALKAFALGTCAGSATTIILPGSISSIQHFGYAQAMFDSEAAKYVQALNLHTYVPLSNYEGFHKDIRKFLAEAGVPDWQVWLTESGTTLEGNGLSPSSRKGLLAHSPEQEMIMAEFFPKSAILHRQGGIFRNWFFLFGCYNEQSGCRDWGSMRRDGTVKPIHAAMSAVTSAIGSARLLGELKLAAGVRAFLFAQPDGTETLAFWSVSNLERAEGPRVRVDSLYERRVSLSVPSGDYLVTDLMGTPMRQRAENGRIDLRATRYPQYLAGLRGFKSDVPPADPGKLTRYVPAADEDLSVVIRPLLNREDFSVAGGSCVAELGVPKGRLRIEVWNFSPSSKKGRLTVSPGRFETSADELELPPWGCAVAEVVYAPPAKGFSHAVDIAGSFDGRRATKVRIPLFNAHAFVSDCEVVPLVQLNDPKAWTRNDSGATYACAYDEAEKAVRFDVTWNTSSGVWFFPVHTFAKGESFEGARYLEFEVKNVQDKVENDMFCVEVMCLYGENPKKGAPFKSPGAHWEKRRVLLPDDAGQMTGFRVGGLIHGHRLSYWIRNFRLLKTKDRAE